jgi:hypothetical protein
VAQLLEKYTRTELGVIYGVSEAAVRKYMVAHNLVKPTKIALQRDADAVSDYLAASNKIKKIKLVPEAEKRKTVVKQELGEKLGMKTLDQVAARTRIPVALLNRAIKDGTLEHRKIGDAVFVSDKVVSDLLKSTEVEPVKPIIRQAPRFEL